MSTDHKTASVQNVRILLDIFLEDSQRNVYAGELEVRPPGAPTTCRVENRSIVGQPSAATTYRTRPLGLQFAGRRISSANPTMVKAVLFDLLTEASL